MIRPALHPLVGAVLQEDSGALAALASGHADWAEILDDAAAQGLIPMLYRRLKRSGLAGELPAAIAERLDRETFALAARNMILADELRTILGALEAHGVACAPLRGPALAERLYGDVTARPFGDLDLLVRKEDLPRVATLLGELGFRRLDRRPGFAEAFSYTLVLVKDRHGWVVIEPHWTIAYPPFVASLDMRRVWERCQRGSVLGVETWVLGLEDLVLHLCLHLLHPDDGAPLLWVYELDRLLRLDEARIDWHRLVSQARDATLDFLLREALWRVKKVFGTPVPDDALAEPAPGPANAGETRGLRRLLIHGRAGGREEVAVLLTLEDSRARLRYALGLLFPATDFMRVQHGITGPVRLAWAYLGRLARLSGQVLKVLVQVLFGAALGARWGSRGPSGHLVRGSPAPTRQV